MQNVHFTVRGEPIHLERPLNSRDPYPLYVERDNDAILVFNDDGSFTDEMIAFLKADD